MENNDLILDVNGKSLKEGDSVTLLSAPDELLSNLPSSDQEAIRDQVGEIMEIQSFDDHGNVELEFKSSKDDMIHYIWIIPKYLRKK